MHTAPAKVILCLFILSSVHWEEREGRGYTVPEDTEQLCM